MVTRRGLLGAAAATAAFPGFASGAPCEARNTGPPLSFVLVHGAWHGGWCWRRVADRLRAFGHEVWTPTLTGLGDRAHLASVETNLTLHIRDVVAVLRTEELRAVHLVGHSYAGMVVSGVADIFRSALRQVIYLDTLIPESGQSLLEGSRMSAAPFIKASADGLTIPVPPTTEFGVAPDSADGQWLRRELRPQPLPTFIEPLIYRKSGLSHLSAAYIRCTRPSLPLTKEFAAKARARGWPVYEIATAHDAMVLEPDSLAALLVRAARAVR